MRLVTIVAAAAMVTAFAAGVPGQIGAGDQTYLAVKLESVTISTYPQGVLDNQISRVLGAAGVKYTPAQVAAASREALSGLKTQLAGRTDTAEIFICVPRNSQNCIKIICSLCSAE